MPIAALVGSLLGSLLIADPIVPGAAAPRVLEGVGLSGKPVALELTGKVTIVDFFATWCRPCREALADYPGLVARFGDQLRLVVVDTDEPLPAVKAYFAHHPLPAEVTVLVDPHGSAATTFGAGSFPTFYFIDPSGVVRRVQRGWGRGSREALAESAARLVGEARPDGGKAPEKGGPPDAGRR